MFAKADFQFGYITESKSLTQIHSEFSNYDTFRAEKYVTDSGRGALWTQRAIYLACMRLTTEEKYMSMLHVPNVTLSS